MLSGNPFDYYRYFSITSRDRDWGLYLTGAGRQTQGPGIERDVHPVGFEYTWDSGRVFEDTYSALLFTEGGKVEFESEIAGTREVAKGDMVLLCPHVWHRYRVNPQIRTTHMWFTFGGSQARSWQDHHLFSPHHPILSIGMVDEVVKPYQRLLECLGHNSAGLQQQLAGCVLEVIGAALANKPEEPACASAIQAAKRLLEQQVEQQVDLKEIADVVGMSYEKFRHAFTESTGLAPYQYHLQLRIRRAQTLLTGTDLTVQEISNRLNFTDAFHLSKVFKAKTGLSPSSWRMGKHSTPECQRPE